MALVTNTDAAEAWRIIKVNAKNIKNNIPQINSNLSAGGITLEYVIDIYRAVRDSMTQLTSLKTTTNLTAYVSDVLNDQTYDVVAQIDAVTNAEQNVLNWIDTNAGGLSLSGDTAENAIANGSVVTNRFSAAQTAPLRDLLTSVYDAVQG